MLSQEPGGQSFKTPAMARKPEEKQKSNGNMSNNNAESKGELAEPGGVFCFLMAAGCCRWFREAICGFSVGRRL